MPNHAADDIITTPHLEVQPRFIHIWWYLGIFSSRNRIWRFGITIHSWKILVINFSVSHFVGHAFWSQSSFFYSTSWLICMTTNCCQCHLVYKHIGGLFLLHKILSSWSFSNNYFLSIWASLPFIFRHGLVAKTRYSTFSLWKVKL